MLAAQIPERPQPILYVQGIGPTGLLLWRTAITSMQRGLIHCSNGKKGGVEHEEHTLETRNHRPCTSLADYPVRLPMVPRAGGVIGNFQIQNCLPPLLIWWSGRRFFFPFDKKHGHAEKMRPQPLIL